MTRGTLFYISEDSMLETCEFNGDMYPDGCAEDFILAFKRGEITNKGQFIMFVQRFNGKNFGYDDTDSLITPYKELCKVRITHCNSDYAYVINDTNDTIKIGAFDYPAHTLCYKTADDNCHDWLVVIKREDGFRKAYMEILTQNISDLVLRAYNNDECPLSERELVGILDEVQRRFIKKL